MHPGDRHYRNQVVRLPDLAVTSDLIEGVTFENCTLVGPAVIILLGGTMQDTGFDGEWDAVLWPLGERGQVVGAIGLVNCSLVGCRLQRIGLAYPPAQEEMIRAGFGL